VGYKVAVLRAPGTNCDKETAWCVEGLGVKAEVIHVKKLLEKSSKISDYDGLILPGGFSYGDHVRAGALLGKMLKERFGNILLEFFEGGKPILGICNGFQVLVELGILPEIDINSALTTNLSSRFECRWVRLKVEKNKSIFTKEFPRAIQLPIAHGEGRFLVESTALDKLKKRGQVVMRYAKKNGEAAEGHYPENPNGSLEDIAGICNPSGLVFGLMPHPERAYQNFTYPNWTRKPLNNSWGDGYLIFKSMIDYIKA
jgi:phosphoribosylformylglycinamidine synthase